MKAAWMLFLFLAAFYAVWNMLGEDKRAVIARLARPHLFPLIAAALAVLIFSWFAMNGAPLQIL